MEKLKTNSFQWDAWTIVVLVLTVVAFILRIVRLDYLTLWVDEYVHTNAASAVLQSPLPDHNGILYTWLIIPLFRLFGETEFWARFPSVVFGTLTVPLMYLFGKKYFNRSVGLFAAVIVTFSLYLVFWSRIARFYAVWTFFFLAFAYFLGQTLNVKNEWKPIRNRLFNYLHCTPKQLIITVVLLLLALISNQMTFLVVYSIGFYHLVVFIVRICRKQYRFLSINALIAYGFALFCAMTFVPAFQDIIKKLLFVLFPEGIWNFLPQLDHLQELWKTKPYDIFNLYLSVFKTDLPRLWVIGLIGLVWGFYRFRKSALFNGSLLAVIFLLMSFIYREPALPRYIIYLYPFFCIGIAIVCYEIVFHIQRWVKTPLAQNVVLCLALGALFLMSPWKQSVAMVKSREHGTVVPPALSVWYFTDWKTPIKKVAARMQPNDVLLSTVVQSAQFYLQTPQIIRFRQRKYNPATYSYENFEADTTTLNANSTEAFDHILNSSDRVWLLADYYFNNVMTDPETKRQVVNRMKFEYDMSNQYVSVFSYDKKNPNTLLSTIFEPINIENPISSEYQFKKPATGNAVLLLDAEGILYDNEIIVQFNKAYSIGVLRTQGVLFNENGDSKRRQVYVAPIPPQILQPGINTFRIGLNTNPLYRKCRVVLYNLQVQENN
ncbi:MAG: glycosyltransferase family 39 protein [Dysgonamonadaceae bacterium]|jgi:4-amino-4-deoxy-L-arabinose transferase-like glycosyltransferase|nr:glycosyltransferase family 39 protein [Dysgonamonadaceae bacterium]